MESVTLELNMNLQDRVKKALMWTLPLVCIGVYCLNMDCEDRVQSSNEELDPPDPSFIALYADSGASEVSIQAAEKMFEWMGYTVMKIKANDILTQGLDRFIVLCIPGGNMYQYAQDLTQEGIEEIRQFVFQGRGYIGICGGAYFTGERVVWQENQLPMNSLGIFPGVTQGPIDEIAPYPRCTMCEINIVNTSHPITQLEPDTAWVMYCYGPMFIPNEGADVQILGNYEIVNQPAMLAFMYGQGRVFIIGVHPELEEDSDRDGVDFGNVFDDRGSDWDLMRKAVHWCVKK